MLQNDILYNIIGNLLDIPSLVNFHVTCKDFKLLFEEKISKVKPCYLNGLRYKKLEKLRIQYESLPDNQERPYNHQPSGTMSWSRIDFRAYPLNILSNDTVYSSTKIADDILDKWFDSVEVGDILYDGKNYTCIIRKSPYTKSQIETNSYIQNISPLLQVIIPPRTNILI
jgi:hypothetical protein